MCGPSLDSNGEVFGFFPRNGRFALPIARHDEDTEYNHNQSNQCPICKPSWDVLRAHNEFRYTAYPRRCPGAPEALKSEDGTCGISCTASYMKSMRVDI